MFTCFPVNFSVFLMYYRKKIKTKIIHNPQALCSVSANNGELVLSSSPKILYMRHLALLFLALGWNQSVVSSHWKLASAQECFMGPCMFRGNMFQCVRLCLCVWLSVCWGRRRGAGHSQRASWHLPNTIWILNVGSRVHVAVDIDLSLSLTLYRLTTYRLWTIDGYLTLPSFLCCRSILHLIAPYLLSALEVTASQIISATTGESLMV